MFRLTIEGGDPIAAALNAMPNRVSRSVQRDALMDGAERIRARAASLAAVRPGAPDLKANLVVGNSRAGEAGDVAVGIGPNSKFFFYDYFQEFGTVHNPAHPFYRPAFDAEVPAALQIITAAFWTALAARGVGQTVSAPTAVSGPGSSLT